MNPDTSASTRQRVSYGAVPLRPWKAKYPGSDGWYYDASRHSIERLAAEKMREYTDVEPSLRDRLGAFALESLLATHTKRIDRNHNSFEVLEQIEHPCENLRFAYEGLARPDELLSVLEYHPDIKSLELAKLSHPFDYDATREMDQVLMDLLRAKSALMLTYPARFKKPRVDLDMPAAILSRKRDVGSLDTKHGEIRVVRRETLLVRAHSTDNKVIKRLIKNEDRFDELTEMVEDSFSGNVMIPPHVVQPMATSYYAKYLSD